MEVQSPIDIFLHPKKKKWYASFTQVEYTGVMYQQKQHQMLVLFNVSKEKVAPGRVSDTVGCDVSMYSTHKWRHTRYTKAQICAFGFSLKNICPAEKIESSCRIAVPSCCCPALILSRSFGEYDSCHAPASMSILDELVEAVDEVLLSSNLETACRYSVTPLAYNCTWVNLVGLLKSYKAT